MNAIATVLLDDLPPIIADNLPEPALAKLAELRTLRDDSRDLFVAADAAFMRLREPGNDLVRAERELALVIEAPVGAIVDGLKAEKAKPEKREQALDKNMERFHALEARVAALRAQHNDARALRDRRGVTQQHHIAVYERVVGWIKDAPPTAFVLADPIDLSGISDLQAELAKTRTLIASLTAEQRRVLSTGIPLVEAEQRIAAFVAAMADRVTVGGLVERGSRPSLLLPENDPEVALLCWLDPKAMTRRLLAEAKEQSDFKHALPEVEWVDQRTALTKRLYEVGLREEALIVALSQQGTAVLRRKDAEPGAVLQLAQASARLRRTRAA
jgi:hypothetical protein